MNFNPQLPKDEIAHLSSQVEAFLKSHLGPTFYANFTSSCQSIDQLSLENLLRLSALIRDYSKANDDTKLTSKTKDKKLTRLFLLILIIHCEHSGIVFGDRNRFILNITEIGLLMYDISSKFLARLRVLLHIIGKESETARTNGVKLLVNRDCVYFTLWMIGLHANQKMFDTFRCGNRISWPDPNDPKYICGYMIHICRKERRGVRDIAKMDPFFVNKVLKLFSDSWDSRHWLLKNILADLQKFISIFGDGVDQVIDFTTIKTPLPCYATLIYNAIQKAAIGKWQINSFEKDLRRRVLPVLLNQEYRLQYFMQKVLKKKKDPNSNRDLSLKGPNPKEDPKGDLSNFLLSLEKDFSKKHTSTVRRARRKMRIWLKKQRIPDKTLLDADCLQEMHAYNFAGTCSVTSLSIAEIFEKVHKIKIGIKDIKKSSLVECTRDFNLTAFSLALLFLKYLDEIENENFPDMRICIITDGGNFDPIIQKLKLQRCVINETEQTIKYNGISGRVSNKVEIRYDNLKKIGEYIAAQEKMGKTFKRLGIFVDDCETSKLPADQSAPQWITLSPMMMMAWIHVVFEMKVDGSSDPSPDKITESVLLRLKFQLPSFSFETELIKKHVEVAISIYLNKNKYVFDNRANDQVKKEEKIQKLFTESWIYLKERTTPVITSTVYGKSTAGPYAYSLNKPDCKLSSGDLIMIIDNEHDWLASIVAKIEEGKQKAVVVTTTSRDIAELHSKLQRLYPDKLRLSNGECVTISSGGILLLDVSFYITVTADNCDVHFIACSFPLNEQENSRLTGNTVCYDSVHSHGYILCKAHFSLVVNCFVRSYFKSVECDYNRAKPMDAPNVVDAFVEAQRTWQFCWKVVEAVKENKSDNIQELFNWVKLNELMPKEAFDTEMMKFGKPQYNDNFYKQLMRDEFWCAWGKHIAKITTIQDIIGPAIFSAKCLTNRPSGTTKHTVMHFPQNPGDCGGLLKDDLNVIFRDRTGFEVELDEDYNVKKLWMLQGSFEFTRDVANGPLVSFKQMHDTKKRMLIYASLERDENVVKYLEQMLKEAKKTTEILSHHMQVLNSCSPGEVYTEPIDEIHVKKRETTFRLSVTNNSSRQLTVEVKASIKGVKFNNGNKDRFQCNLEAGCRRNDIKGTFPKNYRYGSGIRTVKVKWSSKNNKEPKMWEKTLAMKFI